MHVGRRILLSALMLLRSMRNTIRKFSDLSDEIGDGHDDLEVDSVRILRIWSLVLWYGVSSSNLNLPSNHLQRKWRRFNWLSHI